MTTEAGDKPVLVMVASPSARAGECSPFLRFVRDYNTVLKDYSLHCTDGTARSLTGTGLYMDGDVVGYKPGPKGGMVEVAAIVARRKCSAVILLTDALDQGHDEVMTRVVKRIANQAGIRLITTYGDAVLWARLEADVHVERLDEWTRDQAVKGFSNELGWPMSLDQRTVALTAHDASKNDMLTFVEANVDILARHHRILATGTTGWMLKLLLAEDELRQEVLAEVAALAELDYGERMKVALAAVVQQRLEQAGAVAAPPLAIGPGVDLAQVVDEFLDRYPMPNKSDELVGKVVPMLPGPAGGDVLLSKEVLDHYCDTVICLHHPKESLPHTDDSQMLEQTCQLRDVYAGCLTNIRSADRWAFGVRREMEEGSPRSLNDELRVHFGLQEAVVVSFEGDGDTDSPRLGAALCLAGAGYMQAAVRRLLDDGGGRIAVSWGWAMNQVLEQLSRLQSKDPSIPPSDGDSLVWSASIANFPSPYVMNAGTIAGSFRNFFGGEVENFSPGSEGYAEEHTVHQDDRKLTRLLRTADIVLTSASAWDEDAGLAIHAGPLLITKLPDFDDAVGNIGGVFLADDGSEVRTAWSIVGLDYDGLRQAAARRAMILIGAGEGRRKVILAALRARLVSVLITSARTAAWLLDQPELLPGPTKAAAAPDSLRTLLDEAHVGTVTADRLRRALVGSLQLLRADDPTVVVGPSDDDPLSSIEIALLEGEGLDLSPLRPEEDDPVADLAAMAAILLAGALDTAAAATHLGLAEEAVAEGVRSRTLYGILRDDTVVLPAFQFTGEVLVPGIGRVLEAASPQLHVVELWSWFTNPDPDLEFGGRPLSPRDWLLSGGDVVRVVELASEL